MERCRACGNLFEGKPGLCVPCHQKVGFDQRTRCYICMRPLRSSSTGALAFCAECRGGSPFGRVVGLGLHRPPLSTLIHRLKFMGEYTLAPLLGELLARELQAALAAEGELELPWRAIIPVPMHPARERARGYNQAELLAKALSHLWQLPMDTFWLARTQEHGTQVRRSGVARRQALSEAFQIRGPNWWQRYRHGKAPNWRGQAVLLVDDVFTTGATARQCASVLLAAGAARVDAAVLAISGKSTS